MKSYRDVAIVLRCHDLGEADRIVTLFTRDNGIVRAVAKGVRRTKSRFGARLEPFSLIDIQLYKGRNLDTITQVESINSYGRTIARQYEAYTAASAMVETTERLLPAEHEPDTELFALLHGALHAVATGAHGPEVTMNSFLLRAMRLAGWELAVFTCAKCGEEGPHEAFNVHAGGAVCDNCRPPGSITPSVETWQLLGALLEGDWNIADVATDIARRSTGSIVAAYVQWQLERQVKSLRLVNQ